MEETLDVDSEMIALQTRVGHLEWVLAAIVGMILMLLLVVNVMATLSIPKFELIFEDMLGGKALPKLTQMVIQYGNSGIANLVAVGVPFGAFLFVSLNRRARAAWYLSLGVIVLMTVHVIMIRLALELPMQGIITGLGGH